MKTTVYVVTHKKVDLTPLSLSPCYRLIRVGAYGGEPGPLLSDRTGENIAGKNANYCELTALYWIWKNDTASDVVGLCHYRRYFTTAKVSASPRHILTEAQITALMQRYDVVTSRKEYSYRGAYRAYLDCGRAKDVETTEQAIRTLCPEYLDAFRSEFLESSGGYPANMFLCRRPVLDAYCAWLFRILDYVEAHTDLTGYTRRRPGSTATFPSGSGASGWQNRICRSGRCGSSIPKKHRTAGNTCGSAVRPSDWNRLQSACCSG